MKLTSDSFKGWSSDSRRVCLCGSGCEEPCGFEQQSESTISVDGCAEGYGVVCADRA